jgi:hypothetical protein
MQESPVEIQTPTLWNLIGRINNHPAVFATSQQYSLAIFHSRKDKYGTRLRNVNTSDFSCV